MKPIPRLDCHQHFWHLARGDYDWLTSELTPIYRDFLPSHLSAELKRAHVEGTIVVQAAATVAETNYLLSLAEEHSFIRGVVGWVDMESTDFLDSLKGFATHPKFVGIRPLIQDIADPKWMLQENLRPAFEYLVERGLTFDALITSRHLSNTLTLASRYPDLRIVIDHGAKPVIRDGQFDDWADGMAQLANETNVYCKLSGLMTEAGDDSSYEKILPYMDHLYQVFGGNRLMWGSDWPVVNLAADYRTWIKYLERFLSRLPTEDQIAIWGKTAKDFYGIAG